MYVKVLHDKFIWGGNDFFKEQEFSNCPTSFIIFLSINWIYPFFKKIVSNYFLTLLPLQLHFPPQHCPLSALGNAHTFALYSVKVLHIYTFCVTFGQNWQYKKEKRECEYLGEYLISVTWCKLHAAGFGCRKCRKLWPWIAIYTW